MHLVIAPHDLDLITVIFLPYENQPWIANKKQKVSRFLWLENHNPLMRNHA